MFSLRNKGDDESVLVRCQHLLHYLALHSTYSIFSLLFCNQLECKFNYDIHCLLQALAEGLKCRSALFRHEIGELLNALLKSKCCNIIVVLKH